MPGLVLFRRRWAIGSDDLVIPSFFLAVSHSAWSIAEIFSALETLHMEPDACTQQLQIHTVGYFGMLCISVILEVIIGWIATHGSIMNVDARKPVQPFLYTRCALFFTECLWTIYGAIILGHSCQSEEPPTFTIAVLFGTLIFNASITAVIFAGIYISYDLGGGKWWKLRKYQENVLSSGSKLHHLAGSHHRNWRTRKTVRAYQTSWNRRCRLLFCCLSNGQRTSLAEIAQLLSDFFRDLDLVPSDIVAGLLLLRRFQKLRRHALLDQRDSEAYQFLSGAPITKRTKFLDFSDPTVMREYQTLLRYMRFSLAVYGWPMYIFRGNLCRKLMNIVPGLRCICCYCVPQRIPGLDALDDNCCGCHSSALYAVMESLVGDDAIQFVHASFVGGVGVTPYFLALDHLEQKIVVTIRGTLSMKDIVTDLNADAEFIPMTPLQTNPPFLAHKGMIIAAEYVKKKLIEEGKLAQMLDLAKKRSGKSYDLLLVGHSLGAGTAAILAIMLKNQFPTLQCLCFSPPGGLMNLPAAEYSKSFITTCLLGKDMVARLGLHQLEAMRTDLLNVIEKSTLPKWRILGKGLIGCCSKAKIMDPAVSVYAKEQAANFTPERKIPSSPYMTTHPPMFLPGKIIHIVRRYSRSTHASSLGCKKSSRRGEPIYQAIETERENFYELTLSPSMVDDHMPDTLLAAMEKVVEHSKISTSTNGFHIEINPKNEDSVATSGVSWTGSSDSNQEQPRLASSTAFGSETVLPYADFNSPSGELESTGTTPLTETMAPSYGSRSTTPQVRIYACLEEDHSSINTKDMDLSPVSNASSTEMQYSLSVTSAIGQRLAPSVQVKAKSLTELTNIKDTARKTRRKKSSVHSFILGLPGREEPRPRVYSEANFIVNHGAHGDHVHVARSVSSTYGNDLPPGTNHETGIVNDRSFSSLPEKNRREEIYFV